MIRACIEQQSLRYYIEEAKRQNKEYFEMKARDLISKEKDDMVAAVQASLLFQSLNMTREEILAKYPINNVNNKTETLDEDRTEEKGGDHQPMEMHFNPQHQPLYQGMSAEGQGVVSHTPSPYMQNPSASQLNEEDVVA